MHDRLHAPLRSPSTRRVRARGDGVRERASALGARARNLVGARALGASVLASGLLACAVAPTDDADRDVQQDLTASAEATAGEMPWQVQLSLPGAPQWCSGSIIDRHWVLTAGHCAAGIAPGSLTVRAGLHRRSAPDSNVQSRSVAELLVHPAYVAATNDNDIALLHLTTPLTFTPRIQPIVLRTSGEVVAGPGTVSGWGAASAAGGASDVLRKAVLPLVPIDTCNAAGTLPLPVRPSMLCAGRVAGASALCRDEGDPLVVPFPGGFELIGIASWGAASCSTFSVFTHVLKFTSWVRTTIDAAPILGDVNNNGCVDIDDDLAVSAAFGQSAPPGSPLDLDHDGSINIFDRLIVLQNAGAGCI